MLKIYQLANTALHGIYLFVPVSSCIVALEFRYSMFDGHFYVYGSAVA